MAEDSWNLDHTSFWLVSVACRYVYNRIFYLCISLQFCSTVLFWTLYLNWWKKLRAVVSTTVVRAQDAKFSSVRSVICVMYFHLLSCIHIWCGGTMHNMELSGLIICTWWVQMQIQLFVVVEAAKLLCQRYGTCTEMGTEITTEIATEIGTKIATETATFVLKLLLKLQLKLLLKLALKLLLKLLHLYWNCYWNWYWNRY